MELSIDESSRKHTTKHFFEKRIVCCYFERSRDCSGIPNRIYYNYQQKKSVKTRNDHNWSGNSELRYGCLLIHYLAVEKRVNTEKIWKYDTEWYTKRDFLLGRKWPVRFIIIDAVNAFSIVVQKVLALNRFAKWQLKMLVLQRECIMTVITMIGPNWNGDEEACINDLI